jgi:hypothetical protein
LWVALTVVPDAPALARLYNGPKMYLKFRFIKSDSKSVRVGGCRPRGAAVTRVPRQETLSGGGGGTGAVDCVGYGVDRVEI